MRGLLKGEMKVKYSRPFVFFYLLSETYMLKVRGGRFEDCLGGL